MYGDRTKVLQDRTEICTDNSEIYTEGLGPCIAICIAWRHWAIMTHRAEISESEDDLSAMIKEAKAAIPDEVLSTLRPFICGGDTEDRFEIDDPEENRKRVLRGRKRVLVVLAEGGFAKPYVRWNKPNETTALYANLDKGVVFVAVHETDVEHWPIIQ